MAQQTELFVWGNSQFGQLGLGDSYTNQIVNSPKLCSYKQIVTKVACGYAHTCLIMTHGYLYSMGSNEYGQLGLHTQSSFVSTPQLIELGPLFSKVNAAANYTLAQRESELFTWGQNQALSIHTNIPTPIKMKVKSFSCGEQHLGLIDLKGQLFMAGNNDFGQVGLKVPEIHIPTRIKQLQPCTKVRCGVSHTLVLCEGKLYAFGSNKEGQLGVGNKQGGPKIQRIQLPPISKIYASSFSSALTTHNELYIWGSGIFGEFMEPHPLQFKGDIKSLSLGVGFGVVLDVHGQVYTWGANDNGQLGQKDLLPRAELAPVKSLRLKNIKKVRCGADFVMCLSEIRSFNSKQQELHAQEQLLQENRELKSKLASLLEEQQKIKQSKRLYTDIQLTQQDCRSLDLAMIAEQLEQKNKVIHDQSCIIESQNETIRKLQKIIAELSSKDQENKSGRSLSINSQRTRFFSQSNKKY